MCAPFLLVLFLAVPPEDTLEKEIAAQRAAILRKLSEEKLWQDESRKGELRDALKNVERFHTDAFIPVLMKHIDYQAVDDLAMPPVSAKKKFPVTVAIMSIGLPSVQPLLTFLKMESDGRRIALAVHCLVGIYDQAGFGTELTRSRIKLEISTTTGKEKERLEKALEYPVLRKDETPKKE